MSDFFILDGHRVVPVADVVTWGRWLESNQETRRVGLTRVNGYRVSTVFLGLDHRFSSDGPPLVFETMVFAGKGFDDQWMERCSTWAEAEENHRRGIAWAEQQKMPSRSVEISLKVETGA